MSLLPLLPLNPEIKTISSLAMVTALIPRTLLMLKRSTLNRQIRSFCIAHWRLCSFVEGSESIDAIDIHHKASVACRIGDDLPAARLDRSNFSVPILVEYQASNQFTASRRVCKSIWSKKGYDQFVENLNKPPIEDPLNT